MAFYDSPIFYISAPRGHASQRYYNADYRNYISNMIVQFRQDYERRRQRDYIHFQPEPEHTPLQVESTEFYAVDNAKEHHTDQFEIVQDLPPSPILRRGQTFYFAVRFDRELDAVQDIIRLVFTFGPNPVVSRGTKIIIPVTEQEETALEHNKWDARIYGKDESYVTFQVKIPSTAPVGIWKLIIETSSGNSGPLRHTCKEQIYVLFNPWVQEDTVFLDDEELRQEYVLNDTGKVFMGSYQRPQGKQWIYGQFDDSVLPAAMLLLEIARLNHAERGNPIQVVRAISAAINSNDDQGLIVGRWDGNYGDGISPFGWTGSVAIMEKYLKSGGTPVKYGQCWVFSAAAVTICRALGIPARPITNYVSAHDSNQSLTLDKYFTRDGEEIIGGPDKNCFDSCWNFHVWTDVWMARPDLPLGYGGWQLIDATPQERSDNIFRCGPASVEAIRKGEVGFSYDTPFAFAEVNADICHFQEHDESSWGFRRLKLNQYHVGRRIVTKKANVDDDEGSNNDLEDITLLYKNPEGSPAERLAVFNAVRGIEHAKLQYEFPEAHEEDVVFDLIEIDQIRFGDPFKVTVKAENRSDLPRTISAVLSASSVQYTGATAFRLKKAQGVFTLDPNTSETLQIEIPPEDYMYKMVDHNLIKIYAIANVEETKQTWSEEDDFPLTKPNLTLDLKGDFRIGQECTVTFSFQNPLSIPLTECTFSVEGPGLQRPKIIKYKNVDPMENVSFSENFYPKKSGERKILGTFNSKPLTAITGSTTVVIS